MNPSTCDGCSWHSKDPEPGPWVNDDGSPRDDLCNHPEAMKKYGDALPVFNTGCRKYTPLHLCESCAEARRIVPATIRIDWDLGSRWLCATCAAENTRP